MSGPAQPWGEQSPAPPHKSVAGSGGLHGWVPASRVGFGNGSG